MSASHSPSDLRADLEAVRYMLSHDVRAPVRHVRALLDALSEDRATTLDDKARRYVQRAAGAAERLDGLLVAVLEFARLGLRDLRIASLDVGSAVDDALGQRAAGGAARGAVVAREGLEVRVAADRHLLAHVLTHLLGNALKFVAAGQAPEVTIRAAAAGGRVRVSVLDRGIGIAPEHLEPVFAIGAPARRAALGRLRHRSCLRAARSGAHGRQRRRRVGAGTGSAFRIELPAGVAT